MGKKFRKQQHVKEESEDEESQVDDHHEDVIEDDHEDEDVHSQEEDGDIAEMDIEEYNKLKFQKFGQREINNVERIKTRLHEVKTSFYNRLESKKLIKKFGKIPFLEHMSISNEKPCEMAPGAAQLEINDDIKREVLFYNMTRENVMKGMQVMVQAKVPISRPDDFFAEMLKTDDHMVKVKGRLLKQKMKIQKFEEKKQSMENKKFHKAIKSFTQQKRHQEKKDNLQAIDVLKDKIKSTGGDIEEKDFNSIMMKQGSKVGLDPEKGKKTMKRESVMDQIRFGKAKKGEAGR